MNWHGVWVATATPFKNGKVDHAAITRHVEWLLKEGVNGLCPCGTTGEGSSLESEEFRSVLKTVLDTVKGRVPVVPGTGSNNTEHTVERTQLAKELGASGALVVTPYYVKPNPDGLVRHYEAISKAVDLPLFLYNVPGRTAVNMFPETVERVVARANVKGIKECAALPQVTELIERVGTKIAIFSGEDGVMLPFFALGGHGIISVAANVIPSKWVSIYKSFTAGRLEEAQREFRECGRLVEALFLESNPIPVKAALELIGMMSTELRSPLAPISEKNRLKLADEMKRCGLGVKS